MELPRAIRRDVAGLPPYSAGGSIEQVAAELGIDASEVVKLASNESPLPPFPEVVEAIGRSAGSLHRYPDITSQDLRSALSGAVGLPAEQIWVGAGSSDLLRVIGTATGGPGRSAVYPWPSYVVYPLATTLALSEHVRVPLSDDHRIDLGRLASSIRGDTSVVYICNPNNPTGTYLPGDALERFVSSVASDVLIVVDEAYGEFATAGDFRSAVSLVDHHPNLVVTRTFSKVYALAGLRLGYCVGHPDVVNELPKAQAPFAVSSLATAAAITALGYPDRVRERIESNASSRAKLESALESRSLEFLPSQANFVSLRVPDGTADLHSEFRERGVMVRVYDSSWIRVTIGTDEENSHFLRALDEVVPG